MRLTDDVRIAMMLYIKDMSIKNTPKWLKFKDNGITIAKMKLWTNDVLLDVYERFRKLEDWQNEQRKIV